MADGIDREAIARRHGLPEGYGSRLTGETPAACEAIAAAVAALEIRGNPPAVNPNAYLVDALDAYTKHKGYGALIQSIHRGDDE